MANYIVGIVLLVAVILALRSYFGKKYQGCSGCEGCAYSQKCKERNKIKD